MKKNNYLKLGMLTALSIFCQSIFAICPICTIAVGAGVGLSRWLGVDDTISGLWIGGLTVSMILWTISWLNKKNIKFGGRSILITIIYYILVLMPFYSTDIMGHLLNKIWGMDKLLFGIGIGSIFFLIGSIWYFQIKKKRSGHAQFPFQKVVWPIAPLIILTIIFYFMTR